MSKWILILSAATLMAQPPCEELIKLKLDKATVTDAKLVPAATVPAHCAVKVTAKPTSDSEIRIEVWLPAEGWNGKYQQVGNGGWAGAVPTGSLATAVRRGYAAAGTDDGHDKDSPGASWAIGHPEKLIDFGHRALRETTVQAKAIIRAFYRKEIARSYFVGCSDGGREALAEAQRYPEDFDGIIAGAPANDWSSLMTSFIWNQQALLKEPGSTIPPAKLPAIQRAALKACDMLDGIQDGLIEDPRQCGFDPLVMVCQAGDNNDCLTGPQIAALRKVYQGPRNSRTGRQIHAGMAPGTEAVRGAWLPWLIAESQDKSLHYMFGASFYGHAVFEDLKWDIKSLEFDADVEYGLQKAGIVINSSNPDLRSFRAHGGKLIQYHGWGDAAIPAAGSIDYYERVNAFMKRYPDPRSSSRETQDFYRLFLVPGMGHCGNGLGPRNFGQGSPTPGDAEHDVLTALEAWVERDMPPARLIGTGVTGTTPEQPLTRPICVYPQVLRYKGSGDTNVASSFSCAMP
jgi:feruloyl esterase